MKPQIRITKHSGKKVYTTLWDDGTLWDSSIKWDVATITTGIIPQFMIQVNQPVMATIISKPTMTSLMNRPTMTSLVNKPQIKING